jgi:2-polyprenyl-3-methyl-5-hydroxy-6-metoxy-1,4-benzoquinol methylase
MGDGGLRPQYLTSAAKWHDSESTDLRGSLMRSHDFERQQESIIKAFERPGWYIDGFAANIRIRVETINEMLKMPPESKILDVGCGDGSLSVPFLEQGCAVTFLDRSQAMLDIVASRITPNGRQRARFVRSDFCDAEVALDSFDTVICVGVLAYVFNLEHFLGRLASVVNPGGNLIIECSDAAHFLGRIKLTYNRILGIFKPRRFETVRRPRRDVASAIDSAGFELREEFRYTYYIPFISNLMSEETSYRLSRQLFGYFPINKQGWLADESIFHFIRKWKS